MSTVTEIQQAIARLSPEEQRQLRIVRNVIGKN
jgi:hypothetical protein